MIEAATGSGLLAAPSMVIELLLGEAPGSARGRDGQPGDRG